MKHVIQYAGLILSGFLLIVLYVWISQYENVFQLKEHLKIISPIFLSINFFLVVAAIVIRQIVKNVRGESQEFTICGVYLSKVNTPFNIIREIPVRGYSFRSV